MPVLARSRPQRWGGAVWGRSGLAGRAFCRSGAGKRESGLGNRELRRCPRFPIPPTPDSPSFRHRPIVRS
jgi:hypothetical protein